jgi:hypothetical protein
LFLTPAARPLLEQLHDMGESLMTDVLAGIDDATTKAMLTHLSRMKDNLREIIQNRPSEEERKLRYG